MVEEKKTVKIKVPRINLWMISTIALLAILIVVLARGKLTGQVIAPTDKITSTLSADEAGKKAIDYINKYLLRGQGEATLKDIKEENGLYALQIEINGRTYDSYMTMDGKLLFPSAINLTQTPELPQQQEASKFDAPDREKANVKFFVMSFCPFGNQAEFGLEPVYRLLKDKVEWEPHYVIYSNYGGYPNYCLDEEEKYCSMHGIQELNQDIRELCVWKYYDHDTWWDFVIRVNKECNSRNADECWEPIAEEVGIDVDKIKDCQKDEAVSLLEEEVKLNQKYGVRGSPTVFINDVEYRGSRTPEAYKQAICSGFAEPPEECSETLSASGGSATGQC